VIFPRWPAPMASATTPPAEVSPPKVRLQGFSPQKVQPGFALSAAEPRDTSPFSPVLSLRHRLTRRTVDARRRRSDPLVRRGQPQPQAQAGHKRAIRSTIRVNNCRGTATPL
jgi:hypothetical protein